MKAITYDETSTKLIVESGDNVIHVFTTTKAEEEEEQFSIVPENTISISDKEHLAGV